MVIFFYSFLIALRPPEVRVTSDDISTNRGFINGVVIEKILVDSMGDDNLPVKYTVVYSTSCNIHHPNNAPPDPPSKIKFYKPGKYSWDEDTVKVHYTHVGLSRKSADTSDTPWWRNKFGKHAICPLKFVPEQWYFLTIGDPQVTGIFFYIDKSGKEHQYFLESGVSPI